jgi:hypothetical protein
LFQGEIYLYIYFIYIQNKKTEIFSHMLRQIQQRSSQPVENIVLFVTEHTLYVSGLISLMQFTPRNVKASSLASRFRLASLHNRPFLNSVTTTDCLHVAFPSNTWRCFSVLLSPISETSSFLSYGAASLVKRVPTFRKVVVLTPSGSSNRRILLKLPYKTVTGSPEFSTTAVR